MTSSLNILMAQINPLVGAIESNRDHIVNIIQTHQAQHDLIIFPELALSGYPPEDLLLRHEFHARIEAALTVITTATQDCHIVLGHPQQVNGYCYNTATVIHQSQIITQYHKQQLPNYGVFDEKRYFTAGKAAPCVFSLKNYRLGLCICEDLWQGATVDQLLDTQIDILIAINASPFDHNKPKQRELLIQHGITAIYVNTVGGQDELVFDGQSMVMNAQGHIAARAPAFKEALQTIHLNGQTIQGDLAPPLEPIALIYQALVFSLQEYVKKNHIPGVLLGLSGGIDSALTLAIAVDALGPSKVIAVMLPSQFTADISTLDAEEQIATLGVRSFNLTIEPIVHSILTTLDPVFHSQQLGITGENIQARTRGILLMAISNQTGYMLLSTSNKSETAVGYSTLYGDMCGGFAILKDVLKTMVYDLARYRNVLSNIIPERVITRAPSAELAPNQTDQDTLPDYETLDAIIKGYMEQQLSQEQLLALGYPADAVIQTLRRITQNEYKRHQAPPGTKISPVAFGRDWRYPITQERQKQSSK